MSTKSGKSSKRSSRKGDITIKQRDPSWQLRHALGHKVGRNKKQYNRNRSKLVELVEKHPDESVSTIRTWMQEDTEQSDE